MFTIENIQLQEIVQRLGWMLVHFIWQATTVALILAILLRVLQKSTANLRYIIACLAMVLIIALPIITICLVPTSVRDVTFGIGPASPSSNNLMPVEPAEKPSVKEGPLMVQPTVVEISMVARTVSWRERFTELLEPFLPYAVFGWFVGVLGLSTWNLGGWVQLQRLRRKMVKQVYKSLQYRLKELANKLGVNRKVRLLESALVQVPMVVGCLKPVILLPTSALAGLSAEQLEAMLAHELAHIKRFDYLVNMLQTAVEILGFYHPAVWWVSYKIRAERENCCDDLAVSICCDKVSYARALTSMEEIRHSQLAVAASGGSLFTRISRLVSKEPRSNRDGWLPSFIAILLIAAILIPAALTYNTLAQDKIAGEPAEGLTKSLHQAAAGGYIEQVKRLISKGVDVNTKDLSGCTPLHLVAGWSPAPMVMVNKWQDQEAMAQLRKEAGILEMAELLIAQGALINVQDNQGNTPLHHAAKQDNKNVVELLIAKGVNVNAKNHQGLAPIELAMQEGQREVCDLLVAKGAEVSTIYVSAWIGDLAKVKKFINQGVSLDAKENQYGLTALHIAASAGHSHVVEYLIDKGADVNTKTRENGTPLHVVDNADIAEILISRGADVNAKNEFDTTPLHHAVAHGDEDMVAVLLANGADTEAQDKNGQTPMSLSMTHRQREMVLLLVAKGANVNTKDKWGQSALHYAARLGWKDVAEALIANGADIDALTKEGISPLFYATMMGHADVVELLIAKDADPFAKESGRTLSDVALQGNHKAVIEVLADKGATDLPELHLAAYIGNLEKVKSLVKPGKDLNEVDKKGGETPLSYAARGANLDVVRFLLAQGVDVNGATDLHSAVYGGDEDIIELILANGADINTESTKGIKGATPLHVAIYSSQKKDIAELLIEKGADVNACDEQFGTPLHIAVSQVRKEIVQLLISKGSDVNAKGGRRVKGGTPLHAAVLHPYGADVAELLIRYGADVNAKDKDGATLLHLCAQQSWRLPHAELVLTHGADVNARDNNDATSLHYAAESKHWDTRNMIRLLVDKGADVNAKTKDGKTPLSIAQEKDNTEIIDLLRKHGTKE